MDQEIDKIVQAIAIAADPQQSSLHQDALGYLSTVQQNANESWRLALPIFVERDAGLSFKYPQQARFFALRVLDDFLDSRFEPFDPETFGVIQQSLVGYIQSEYVYGNAEAGATFLRNKFSHTLTLFFLCSYIDTWPSFFSDLFTLLQPSEASSPSPAFNRHIALLFFHITLEISGEVADQLLKSARSFSNERHARDARVRDAVRERDAMRINEAVLAIITDGVTQMSERRKQGDFSDSDQSVEIVDLGIRTFASYVGWIDINLTVTPTTVPLLFTMLGDASLPIRLATSVALLRIVAKGLKEPGDKLQLLKVLSLGQVIDALEAKTRTQQIERGSDTDEGEESYREALGKLLNVLGLELIKLDECQDEAVRAEAAQYLEQLLPVMIRFMADEYDDTSSTIFPLLQTVMTNYKRVRKASSQPLDDTKRGFLSSLLQVLIEKLKWDDEADPEDDDDDDNAEFLKMRKELRTFMDSVLVIDQDLVTEAVRALALNTVNAYQNGLSMKWNDAELGIYMIYIYGEINKSGGKGRAAFCLAPPAAERTQEKKRAADYSKFPLTTLGELMLALVQSGLSAFPHKAVSLQFFETVARYSDFFKVRKECIVPILEAMVDSRGMHSEQTSFRLRLFFLFSRFIKDARNDIPPSICASVAESFRDLLPITVVLPDPDEIETDLITDAVKDAVFDSQLYLYETIGILTSLTFETQDDQKTLLLSFIKPLINDLSESLMIHTKGGQDITSVIRTRHIIMALGNISKGFNDYPSPVPEGYLLPPLDVFTEVAQAIIVCLQAMSSYRVIRDASRFAFARILATAGPHVTHFIPALMSNLLTQFESSELVDFMNFIGLLVFKRQKEMFSVVDELLEPLNGHISSVLSQPITGPEEQRSQSETKKSYVGLLSSIMSAKLDEVFISQRNNGSFDSLLQTMQTIVSDISDPSASKVAILFLIKCINVWGAPTTGKPGFERIIYERLVPSTFAALSAPDFNPKDGQTTVMIQEIANLLHAVSRIRGQEAYEYLLTVYLPSQNWPMDAASDFTSKLRDLDARNFRKYFTDFVRSTRS